MKFPRWRKATWALLVWSALILLWIFSGLLNTDCGNEAKYGDSTACGVGAGLAIFLILGVGFFGFVFLPLIWFMSRPKTRLCPQCGNDVKKGQTTCPTCGFSFVVQPGVIPAQRAVGAAGWYEDSTKPGQQRYWDGTVWEDQWRPSSNG